MAGGVTGVGGQPRSTATEIPTMTPTIRLSMTPPRWLVCRAGVRPWRTCASRSCGCAGGSSLCFRSSGDRRGASSGGCSEDEAVGDLSRRPSPFPAGRTDRARATKRERAGDVWPSGSCPSTLPLLPHEGEQEHGAEDAGPEQGLTPPHVILEAAPSEPEGGARWDEEDAEQRLGGRARQRYSPRRSIWPPMPFVMNSGRSSDRSTTWP
jgi:hypothetical protein